VNLISNGYFASGLTGWNTAPWEGGTASAGSDADAADGVAIGTGMGQDFGKGLVTCGHTYTLRLRAKRDGGTGWMGCGLDFRDEYNTEITIAQDNDTEVGVGIESTDFAVVENSGVGPAGTVQGGIWCWADPADGKFVIDSLELFAGTLTNAGGAPPNGGGNAGGSAGSAGTPSGGGAGGAD
jgi:hypothetical protein